MKRLTFIFLILFILVHFSSVQAARYEFQRIGSMDGLSSVSIKSITQDSYGFIWLGTTNGLERYDGQSLTHFDCWDYATNQGNDNIDALMADDRGNVWVGTDRGMYLLDEATGLFSRVNSEASSNVFLGNWIRDVKMGRNGEVWVLSPSEGVFCYKPMPDGNYQLHKYELSLNGQNVKEQIPNSLAITAGNEVLVGTIGMGLFTYNQVKDDFVPILALDGSRILSDCNIAHIEPLGSDMLVVGTQEGHIYLCNPKQGQVTRLSFSNSGNIYLYDLMCHGHEVWIATEVGLYIIDLVSGQETCLTNDSKNPYSLSDNVVYCLYSDKDNGVWIGTTFGGVNVYSLRMRPFQVYGPTSDANSLDGRHLRGLAFDNDGKLWIGSDVNSLNIMDPASGQITSQAIPYQHSGVLQIRCANGNIYTGLSRNGMLINGKHHLPDTNSTNTSVYCTLVDSRGDEWVGLDWSLMRRRSGEETFTRLEATGYDWIFDIIEASDHTFWIATMGNGIWHYDPASETYTKYSMEDGRSGLRSNSINSCFEDSKHRMWFSTDRGGLSLYHPESDSFETFGMERGLPDNFCYDMLEDDHGHLWFGTNKGLVCFCPDDTIGHNDEGALLRVRTYTMRNGLPSNQFNYHAACRSPQGVLYFGTIDGLIAFDPHQVEMISQKAEIYFTNIQTQSQSHPIFTEEVVLPYDSSFISIHVASPDFSSAVTPIFTYKLDNYGDDWNILPSINEISLAGLSPGKHLLTVRAERLGITSERELRIVVMPPWWLSKLAYFLYVLTAVVAVVSVFLYYRRRTKIRLQEHKKLYALHMEKRLNENKVQFFTEIAHEIRTPLTLIDSPLEAMEDYVASDRFVGETIDMDTLRENSRVLHGYLDTMRRNTRRLLDLTSQLLDFQKIGLRKLKLHYETVEVRALIEDVVARFQPAFSLKKKSLTCNLGDEDILAAVDREALTKIVSNLLNNALKYAHEEVSVSLSCEENMFRLEVESDSDPIATDDQEHIFEPFYQIDGNIHQAVGGVGIGLPLSRQLARQHQGDLSVTVDSTNHFILTMPLNKEAIQQQNAEKLVADRLVMSEVAETSEEREVGYSILLVEDNDEMRTFLAEQLSHHYTVVTAVDGSNALEVLKDHPVDLLLSDVMMPVMDGFELCKSLKQDERYSNVPVVLLTAKNDTESKVRGLQLGAEAYIEKPFSIKYLRQQLRSILDNRRRERLSFQKKPFFNIDNMKVAQQDEEYMKKVVDLIEQNMADEKFGVDQMAEALCVSRSTLLRRIKSLYGQSPLELIRTVRLRKAAELIQTSDYKLSEVGYIVGISSPSYFSKLFFKQFGIMPSDFAAQCKGHSK